jgi:DNA-binding SARP family transcriptional activator/class 3 adenylate cyclase
MGDRPPEGPLTILFSDVEGSTSLRTERGDTVANRILRAHEEIVRRCVAAHDGWEVKALGDGFMVAFTSVRRALACAVAIQQDLAGRNRESPGDEVRIRIGLNTGEVVIEGDDVYGQAVNAAARIAGRAETGEILVSEIVRQLAGSGPEFIFADRGRCRLKGFPDRWHLYGLVYEAATPRGGGGRSAPPEAGLRLLGPVELVAEFGAGPGDPVTTVEIGSPKQRAVLAVLALRVNEVVSRDALVAKLWGDDPPASATVTLRSLVSRLRRVLEDGAGDFGLETREPGWVLRAHPATIDAGQFEALTSAARAELGRGEAAAAARRLRRALALWRGDALVDVIDAGYLAAEATRLDEARLAAVEDLAEAELASGGAADALARLEPHVAEHPLRERAWGQLMVALYRLGRQAEALRAYQRLRTILGEELGIAPTPTLADLEARILRHDPGLASAVVAGERLAAHAPPAPTGSPVPRESAEPPVPLADRTPFVGRVAERAAIGAVLARARAGSGGMVLIGGEPGIGKTRLAEESAADAAGAGMGVFAGHSYEMAGASPYVAFVEILEAALAAAPDPEAFVAEILGDAAPEVARLLPQLRRRFPGLPPPLDLPPTQERQYLFRCLSDVLARLAAARPTLLLLDDLQWADEPTLVFVEHLAPQLGHLPLAVIATYRDVDVGRPLAHAFEELHRRRLAQRIKLGALSPSETGEVVRVLAGQEPPVALVDGLHVATDGNVFFLEEVFRDLVEQDRLFDAGGDFLDDVDVKTLGVPDGVRLVIGRRLERLSADAQRLLSAAAVAGRVFSFPLLQALGDFDGDTVLDVIDEAERATLIAPGAGVGDDYLFVHELIRQTLTAGLSAPRRRRAHLRAAEAMITTWAGDLDGHAAEIAHHLTEAGDAAEPKQVFAYRLRAGRRALDTSAFEEAFFHLDRAAALCDVGSDAQRGDLFFALGRAHRSLGHQPAVLTTWERARREYVAAGDGVAAGRVSVEMGLHHAYAGHLGQAEEEARRGLGAMGDGPFPERARLLSLLAVGRAVAGDADGSDAFFADALAAAAAIGDETVEGFVLADQSLASHGLMRAPEAVDTGLRAAAALRRAGELWEMVFALWPTGFNLMCMGRFAESAPVLEEFLTLARRLGHFSVPFERRVGGPREFFQSGDLDALVASLGREIALFDEYLGSAWVGWTYSWMGTAEFLRGDWDTAEVWLRRGADVAEESAWTGWCWGSWFLYLVYAGRRDEALAVFDAQRATLGDPVRPATSGTWGLLFALTEGLFLLGERSLPARWYPLIVVAQRVNGIVVAPYAPGQLLDRVAGIAAQAAGDHDVAEVHFRRAVDQAETLPHRFEQCETRRFYAEMLRERDAPGDGDRARRLMTEAAEGFTRMKMPRHAALAVGP